MGIAVAAWAANGCGTNLGFNWDAPPHPRQRVPREQALAVERAVFSDRDVREGYSVRSLRYVMCYPGGPRTDMLVVDLRERSDPTGRRGVLLTLKLERRGGGREWVTYDRAKSFGGIALGSSISFGEAEEVVRAVRRIGRIRWWRSPSEQGLAGEALGLSKAIRRDHLLAEIMKSDEELAELNWPRELVHYADYVVVTWHRVYGPRGQKVFVKRDGEGFYVVGVYDEVAIW
jgi:hypothetical protein